MYHDIQVYDDFRMVQDMLLEEIGCILKVVTIIIRASVESVIIHSYLINVENKFKISAKNVSNVNALTSCVFVLSSFEVNFGLVLR